MRFIPSLPHDFNIKFRNRSESRLFIILFLIKNKIVDEADKTNILHEIAKRRAGEEFYYITSKARAGCVDDVVG